MEDSKTAYPLPENFNPWTALDAIRGLADALHQMVVEGPAAEDAMSDGDHASLEGLTALMREKVHALHAYFRLLGDITTVRLPVTAADFEAVHVKHAKSDEVREEAPLYLVR